MEEHSPGQLIKAGFWLGIGYLIPGVALGFVGSFALFQSIWASADAFDSFSAPDFDKTDVIELGDYRTEQSGKRLLILGTLTNTTEQRVNSVTLEAELFDSAGRFVYECTEHVGRVGAGKTENFQIKCGCSKSGIPAHETVEVRVVRASSY